MRNKRPATVAARIAAPAAILAAALFGALVGAGGLSAQSVPPDEAWQTITTPHFRVTFPASLDALGRRAAWIAEDARSRLEHTFVEAPKGRIDLVLTDHADVSNGFATVAPLRRVVVYARPPIDGGPLSSYDDWLDLVIVHELAHIFHLDLSGAAGNLVRALFGRVPVTWPVFSNQATPRWIVEGLATWYESALTGAGRVEGTAFPMYLRTAALAGRLERLDQASGESAVWPHGQRPYLYGSHFFAWLTEHHGAEGMARFVEAVAGQWVPYRLDAAARSAFGVSFSAAWAEWVQEVSDEAEAVARTVRGRSRLAEPELLTHGARQGLHPRPAPDGDAYAYSRNDGRSDARIVVESVDGDEVASVRTNAASTFSWMSDGGLLFEQFELEGQWRFWTDLFVWRPDGSVRRITRGARVDQPSASPDGRWAAAVRSNAGHIELVRVDLGDGAVRLLAGGSDSLAWAFPAVSPDGRWIAASVWRPGTQFGVVVVDAETGASVLEVSDGNGVDLAPAWSPDGQWLVWASDRTGIANLYAATVDPERGEVGALRQVTDLVTGVAEPAVSYDGAWIYHSLYTAEGWEVARVPFAPADWRDPVPPVARHEAVPLRIADAALDTLVVTPYRSAATLRLRYWEPLVESAVSSRGTTVLGPFVGAQATLSDVIQRHRVGLAATVAVDGGEVAGSADYTWSGWGNPLLSLAASQGYDAAGPLALPDGTRGFIQERERRASAGLTFLRARWRSALSLTGAAGLAWEDRTLLGAADLEPSPDFTLTRPTSRLADLRVTASWSSVRGYALSISPERGFSVLVQARTRPQLDLADSLAGVVGSDRSVDDLLGRVGGYYSFDGWGWARHVLALRLAGGRAVGPGADGFWYGVGGASAEGESIKGIGRFGGRSLFFPVRGFSESVRGGNRAWTASLEWRFPIWWVNAGAGAWPLHLDRIHGALFADAGNAWGPVLAVPGYDNPRGDALTSVGAELRFDALVFFTVPLELRVGAAAPLSEGSGARVFVRLGSGS